MTQLPDDFSVGTFQNLLDEGKFLGVSCKSCEQVFVLLELSARTANRHK